MNDSQDKITTEKCESAEAPVPAGPVTVEAGPAPADAAARGGVETGERGQAERMTELEAKAAKAQENWERYVRTVADLENYKKRAAREKQEAARYANEALMGKLVPVLDTFEMALSAANTNTTLDALKTGVAMIRSQLKSILDEAGLEEVDAAGKPFDPNWHEAVSQQETSELPEGHVAQQIRKGYKFRERLLRPAAVVVARPPAPK